MLGAPALAIDVNRQGVVEKVFAYGNGGIVVTGINFSTTSCLNNSFVISGGNLNATKLLAAIRVARATGATLVVNANVDNCNGWYPEVTLGNANYIRILP